MTSHISEAVFWTTGAAALVLLFLLLRQLRVSAQLRKSHRILESGIRSRDEEIGHLVEVSLPAMLEPYEGTAGAKGNAKQPQLGETPFATRVEQLTGLFIRSGHATQLHAEQAAKSALKASMRAIQSLSNEQQLAISQMQEAHDDPQVLQDLLEIDHMNAQIGRRAQAIAVLCGSWPGRQRASAPLVDVVRGATSRIRDYRRVQVHAQADAAVISRAVEPVVLAIAELLDNAARHSQPNTTVQVGFQLAHNGVSIVIDDAGVGLQGRETQRASTLLSGEHAVDVSQLGDPPQFGFAVIGLLAVRYGFHVSVDTRSPYGGVRAVVFLPSALLASPGGDQTGAQPISQAIVPRALPPEVRDASASFLETHGDPSLLLPQRRRRRQVAERPAVPARPQHSVAEVRTARDAAAVLGAFSRGTRAARSTSQDAEGMSET